MCVGTLYTSDRTYNLITPTNSTGGMNPNGAAALVAGALVTVDGVDHGADEYGRFPIQTIDYSTLANKDSRKRKRCHATESENTELFQRFIKLPHEVYMIIISFRFVVNEFQETQLSKYITRHTERLRKRHLTFFGQDMVAKFVTAFMRFKQGSYLSRLWAGKKEKKALPVEIAPRFMWKDPNSPEVWENKYKAPFRYIRPKNSAPGLKFTNKAVSCLYLNQDFHETPQGWYGELTVGYCVLEGVRTCLPAGTDVRIHAFYRVSVRYNRDEGRLVSYSAYTFMDCRHVGNGLTGSYLSDLRFKPYNRYVSYDMEVDFGRLSDIETTYLIY